jgi:predicted ATPase
MKISIRHLGKIERADLDVRPLTLIVGENNTNKTWTAYSIYALLRSLSRDASQSQNLAKVATRSFEQHIQALAAEAASRIAKISTSANINLEFSREAVLSPITANVRLTLRASELAQVLAVPLKNLKRATANITIPKQQLRRGSRMLYVSIGDGGKTLSYAETSSETDLGSFEGPIADRKDLVKLLTDRKLSRLSTTWVSTPPQDWTKRLASLLVEFAVSSLNTVTALPAERKALVALYQQLESEDTAHLPLPLSDFISRMKQVASWAEDAPGLTMMEALYSKLEAVLGGHVHFEPGTSGPRLVFNPTKTISLPIQATSSMVRSLASLLFMGPRLFQSGSALIIDEPEMNAHPSAQLAIIEFLAALANRGNYIVVTTHSPYIVDHVNNLLAAGELRGIRKKKATQKFALGLEESFLAPDVVSAYEFLANGSVRSLLDKKRHRITTTTFGDVSSALENLYSELIESNSK